MSTLASPIRRVLGQKDVNAPLQTHSPKASQHAHPTTGPPASDRVDLKRPLSPSSSMPTSPRVGQKRKIHQVRQDPPEESQTSNVSQHPLSQMTDLLSDASSQHVLSPERSMLHTKSTPNTVFGSFHASQDDSQALEAHFVIHEEVSQRTLDKMHAVVMPQNTSQLVPALRPTLVQETSQASLSMSSLIDFEHDASAESDNLEYIEDKEVLPKQRPQTEDETRKEMLVEKAETLRTRLQLAIFKVQTNQVTKPFARLQLPKQRSSSPDIPAHAHPSSSRSSTIKGNSVQPPVVSPETRVAVARARATMGPKPVVRSLASIPVPSIAPTAYSARWTNDRGQPRAQPETPERAAELPSSPPSSQEGSIHHVYDTTTPKRAIVEPRTPLQLSSPVSTRGDESGIDSAPTTNRKATTQQPRPRQLGLTSSVVKGEAANGLLQLMRDVGAGATRSGGSGMCGL